MEAVVKFVSGGEGPGLKLRQLLALAGAATLALRYCLAAQQDERNGFPFTAAMEWHKAADLLVPIAPFADLCWRKWEQIVRLPRQMAAPISDPLQGDACAPLHPVPIPVENQPLLLISA